MFDSMLSVSVNPSRRASVPSFPFFLIFYAVFVLCVLHATFCTVDPAFPLAMPWCPCFLVVCVPSSTGITVPKRENYTVRDFKHTFLGILPFLIAAFISYTIVKSGVKGYYHIRHPAPITREGFSG
jgi:succinate-acetate transporter protein